VQRDYALKMLIFVPVYCNKRARGLCVENFDFFVSVYCNKRARGFVFLKNEVDLILSRLTFN